MRRSLPSPGVSSPTLPPDDLARELADKNGTPPTLVCVDFRTLFVGGHIEGASFDGTASTEQGLATLKKWADHLPRSTNLVIYCGCCPFDKCPNIRPAYTALSEMGFKKLRVLVLPTNFATDWVEKGYPTSKEPVIRFGFSVDRPNVRIPTPVSDAADEIRSLLDRRGRTPTASLHRTYFRASSDSLVSPARRSCGNHRDHRRAFWGHRCPAIHWAKSPPGGP